MSPVQQQSRAGMARPISGGRPVTRQGDDALVAAVIAGLVSLLALAWAGAQLAARWHAGAWLPGIDPVDVARAAIRLAGAPGQPQAAWPADAAVLLPGALGYWSAQLAVVVLLTGPLSVGLRRHATRRRAAVTDAHWATRRDLRPLYLRKPAPGRLVIGRPLSGRGLLAVEAGQSLAVIGPTQSGKTTGLAVPAILEWDGPVVATSVKSDLLRDTLAWRERQGEAWIYDPTACTGLPGATWTPLATCADWQGALRVASWMARTVKQTGGAGLTDGDFWYASAAKLLAPLLFAAARGGLLIGDVVRWVDTHEEAEPSQILIDADVPEAIAAAIASFKRESRQKSSVYTTAETVVAAYADPTVALSARNCDIRAERLLDGGNHTLYLCAPVEEQDRLRPLFVSLLQTVIAAANQRAHRDGRPLNPRLLLVLDEAANIATLPDLDKLASTAAGQGMQLVTVWQDLAQMRDRYGDRAHTLLNNHRATLLLRGIKDPATLEHASRLVGDAEQPRVSTTTDATGRRSSTASVHQHRLAPDHALRSLPDGHGLLVYGALPPTRIRLCPWYRNRTLTARAAVHPTGQERGSA